MEIHTSRFGTIDVPEEEFIYMKGAILGFERLTRFVLLIRDDRNPLGWLQAVDDPAVAFVVVNPRLIKRDYDPPIDESELEFLDIKGRDDIALLAIVTLRSNPFRVTANLRAPLLINAANRMGNQIVLDEPAYPVQFDILDNRPALQEKGSEEGKGLERLAKPECAAPV